MPKSDPSAEPLPKAVILLADHAGQLAGTVLRADADLVAQLDVEGVRYRPANERECRIAGLLV